MTREHHVNAGGNGTGDGIEALRARIDKVLDRHGLEMFHVTGKPWVTYDSKKRRVVCYVLPHASLLPTHADLIKDAIKRNLPSPPFTLERRAIDFEDKNELGLVVLAETRDTLVVVHREMDVSDDDMSRIYKVGVLGLLGVLVLAWFVSYFISKETGRGYT